MDVTVGVCAHNEEANISRLLEVLLSQKLNEVHIKQLIVVSSGSTDSTDKIVQGFRGVQLITERKRTGKVSAINRILAHATADVIVLISADVLPNQDCIEQLCKPLKASEVGIVGSRPIPLNPKQTWMGFVVQVVWGLHHQICLRQPKFGECIAFRRTFQKLPMSAVDEEEIASIILQQGYKPAYAPKAIVHNKGPETALEFLRQRRRIYAGHLTLRAKTGHAPPTMSNAWLAWLILSQIELRAPLKTVFAILLEATARALGYWDFLRGRHHYIWETASTTKQLT